MTWPTKLGVNGLVWGWSRTAPRCGTSKDRRVGCGCAVRSGWLQRAVMVQLTGCTQSDNHCKRLHRAQDPPVSRHPGRGAHGDCDLAPKPRWRRPRYGQSTDTMTMLAAATAADGTAGAYSATPHAAASSWSAGGSSGTFAWSHPITMPPSPGDLHPDVALTYDSGSLDGRVARYKQPAVRNR